MAFNTKYNTKRYHKSLGYKTPQKVVLEYLKQKGGLPFSILGAHTIIDSYFFSVKIPHITREILGLGQTTDTDTDRDLPEDPAEAAIARLTRVTSRVSEQTGAVITKFADALSAAMAAQAEDPDSPIDVRMPNDYIASSMVEALIVSGENAVNSIPSERPKGAHTHLAHPIPGLPLFVLITVSPHSDRTRTQGYRRVQIADRHVVSRHNLPGSLQPAFSPGRH